MHRNKRYPIIWYCGSQNIPDGSVSGRWREWRWLGALQCHCISAYSFSSLRGHTVLNGPNHPGHLIAEKIDFFHWIILQRMGNGWAEIEQMICCSTVRSRCVDISLVKHCPTLPIIF